MIRTQIQMTEEQVSKLKRLSSREHKSIAELIRQAVDRLITTKAGIDIKERQKRAIDASGRFHFRLSDFSANHDKYLSKISLFFSFL